MDSGARLMEFQDALVARSAAASFTLFKSAAEHGGFRQRRVLDFRDHGVFGAEFFLVPEALLD